MNQIKSLPNHKMDNRSSGSGRVPKEAPSFICGGSYTVEAAIVLPLLTCFFASLLFLFHVLLVQILVQTELEETGRKLAVYAGSGQEGELGNLAQIVAAKILLQKELGDEEEVDEWILGGAAGISLLESKTDGDYIELVANYRMKLPLSLLQPLSVSVMQKTKVRKWTGWNPNSGEEEDPWVYITENGSVYHTTKSCSYLKLSIRPISIFQLERERNRGGAVYYACPLCVKQKNVTGIVYITDYGNRYHTDLNCSGLKRTIYAIRKSEVGDRAPCSKCGKKEE